MLSPKYFPFILSIHLCGLSYIPFIASSLYIRPAENIFGQNAQTPRWTLGQNISAYQFWAIWRQFLPRRKSFEVSHFKVIIG